MNKWQLLCSILSEEYSDEKELEAVFRSCLILALSWSRTDIGRQVPIPMQYGHELMNKRADLVIFDGHNQPLFIIEMKKQGVRVNDAEVGQLYSYLLHRKCRFGLLVGDRISLYYNKLECGGDPERVLTLSFRDRGNKDGKGLAAILDKRSFDSDKMMAWCESYITQRKEVEARVGSWLTIDNLASSVDVEQMDSKIRQLIELYREWLKGNEKESRWLQVFEDDSSWIEVNILKADLARLSDADFTKRFRGLCKRLNIRRYLEMWNQSSQEVLAIRQDFVAAIRHLSEMSRSKRWHALEDFVDGGDFTVKHLKSSFWSELVRVKFPDVPLLNNKTENFFDAIGVYIGDSYEEKLMKVSKFYKHFTCRDMSLNKLSHMEHFALVQNAKNETGRNFMKVNFSKQ